ncbi:MAG: hypothetical protein KDD44_15065, partial [Bdellovibrionales bacterium]|nr:hypothetical protein [Bdellovibrionales bacterium]
LVDNMDRTDLRPSEQALGFQRLMDLKGWSARQLADALCTSRTRVEDTIRLLSLPRDLLDHIDEGRIPRSAGYKIAKLPTERAQRRLSKEMLEGNLTVGELAAKVRTALQGEPKRKKPAKQRFFRWQATIGRGMRLFLSSRDALEPHQVVGAAYEGVLRLVEQELATEQDGETPGLTVDALRDLIDAFSRNGAELQFEFEKALHAVAPILILQLLAPLSSADRTVRNQAVTAFSDVENANRVLLDRLVKLGRGREDEISKG